jgi:outer membrane protein insertion porin family
VKARSWTNALSIAAAVLLFAAGEARAQVVSAVTLEGNRRVETEAIRVNITLEAGRGLDQTVVDRDIRAIYEMGFFDDVWVTAQPSGGGLAIVYHVAERPYVERIEFKGVDNVKEDDLAAVINVTPRTIFDPQRVWVGLEQARKFYSGEGYPDAKIDYSVDVGPNNDATLVYHVNEGELIRVEKIRFEGAKAFSKRKLRKIMTTRERWILSFVTGAGLLNEDELATDVERLTAFYYDQGYIHARIDEPRVERVDDGLEITVKVDEGPLFHVRSISFAGDVLMTDQDMRARLGFKEGDVFRASQLREAVFSLTEGYGDLGYAFAEITPDTRTAETVPEIDVRFAIKSGDIVFIRRIEIQGNTKTRDKVVRRELGLEEGQKFSGTGLRESKTNVNRVGYFEEVEITTNRTDRPDQVDVVVNVKEGRTGAFSAGAGFSSADALLFNARVSEQNLFGRGQRLVFNADIGSIRQNFQISFTEPWFMNRPLAVGFDIFDWRLQFDRFTRGATGFGLRASYPLEELGLGRLWGMSLNRVRAGIEYRLEQSRINGVSQSAPPDVKDEEGTRLQSSVTPSLTRNTLNHAFDPTGGSRQTFAAEFSGLGGDTDFIKLDLSGRWYWPIFKMPASTRSLLYSLGASIGYGWGESGRSGEDLPVFDRYFPGGMNSHRAYNARDMGPTQTVCDEFGDRCDREQIGGSAELIMNNEIIVPIVPDAGVNLVLWCDIGEAYLKDDAYDLGDLKYGIGPEVRWLSPFGPLRISYGWNLFPEDGDDRSLVLFSFGSPF